jgi:endonuclease/exonuclease/phosphatase (EEP) superfamily protein YafD
MPNEPEPSCPPADTAPGEEQRTSRRWLIAAWILVVLFYLLQAAAFLGPSSLTRGSGQAAQTYALLRLLLPYAGGLLVLAAAAAAWRRRWRLVAAALPLLVLCLVPGAWRYRPAWARVTSGEEILVVTCNVLGNHDDPPLLIRELLDLDPDLLCLQEYTPAWHDACRKLLAPRYPHAKTVVREDSFGLAVYSKRPLFGEGTLELGGSDTPQMRLEVKVSGQRIALYNIHLLPTYEAKYMAGHNAQIAALGSQIEAEPRPVILCGDLNFGAQEPGALRLKAAGLHSTADEAGWGAMTTWPNGFFDDMPEMRFDHVFLGGGLVCDEVRTGTGEGTDHRPVIARIGFAR